MKKTYYLFALIMFYVAGCADLKAQTTTVFSDNFDRATFLTGNAYGTPPTTYTFTLGSTSSINTSLVSGSNYIGNINNGAAANRALFVAPMNVYSSPFNTILGANTGVVTWTFNMRTNTAVTSTTLATGTMAGGIDLCGNAAANIYNGSPTGYGVVFNSSATGGVALVKFASGLNLNTVLITETTTVPKTDYYSVKVTYDPATNLWSLYLRDDGASAFADPLTGSLTLQGTATDATYTNQVMTNFGAVYTWTATVGKTMSVDNYTVSVTQVACAGMPAGTVAATATNGCGFYTTNLYLLGCTGSGLTYQWQSSPDNSTWTSVSGATNANYNTAVTANIYYRCQITCTAAVLTYSTASITLNYASPPTVATLPFSESFESAWISTCDLSDQPNSFWVNALPTGNRSWRRDDDAVGANTAAWGSPTFGAYAPAASLGSHSARFHSYATAAGNAGALYLFVNLGVAGTKQITYDYINPTGTDALICQVSTDGGLTFSTIDVPPVIASSWTTRTLTTTATAPMAIIRFVATSDNGNDDIGLDNVNIVQLCVTPVISGPSFTCVGTAVTLNSTPAGTWSSGTPGVATINVGTGALTSLAAGTTLISSNNGTGCVATMTLTVNPTLAAITGTTNVCPGATTSLNDGVAGGTCSSSNNLMATVGSTGIVTGVAVGSPSVSYTTSPGCITATVVTVNPLPSVAAITGTAMACAGGATTPLNDGTVGGVWSSVTPAVATVGTSGIVTGVSGGNSIISYTVTNSCGVIAATSTVTVNPLPAAPALITGTPAVCAGGATAPLGDVTPGGTWSSTNTALATVGSTGTVTGVAAGNVIISYTLTNGCGSTPTTVQVTVNPLPVVPASITGIASVCAGGGTTALNDVTPGGVWSSVSLATATVDGSGNVTGLTAGTSIISYTETTVCGSNAATTTVTVNLLPSLTSLSASANVCYNAASSQSASYAYSGISGGADQYTLTWSPGGSLTDVASFTALPVGAISVTIPAGAAANSYTGTLSVKNSATGCVSTSTVSLTVNGLPGLVGLPVAQQVCFNAASGQTASFPYTGVTNGANQYTLTWLPGGDLVDVGLYSALPGSPSGSINVSVPAGSISGSYGGTLTVKNSATGCAGVSTITTIVNDLPTLTGLVTKQDICDDSVSAYTTSINYTGTTAGADSYQLTWLPAGTLTDVTTSLPAGAITVNVPAATSPNVFTGTLTIMNSVTGCKTTSKDTVTLNGLPAITGLQVSQSFCFNAQSDQIANYPGALVGSPTKYGLTWSPSGVLADVSPFGFVDVGIPSGLPPVTISAGTPPDTYVGHLTLFDQTTGCTATSALDIVVNAPPLLAGLTKSQTICYNNSSAQTASFNYSGIIAGANQYTLTWPAGSGLPDVAAFTLLPGGTITVNVPAGTAVNTYHGILTLKNSVLGCTGTDTLTIVVNPLPPVPGPIAGPANICFGSTKLLSDAVPGGTWSSTDNSVASIDAAGHVTAVNIGAATISYTITNSCGAAAATSDLNVIAGPSAITGASNVCEGGTTPLGDPISGGSWSTSDPALATIDPSGGVLFGVVAGTAAVTYTASTGCLVTTLITINPAPAPITGAGVVCEGAVTTLEDITFGGTWSSSDPGSAAAGAGAPGVGIITGITFGNPVITYTLPTGCTATSAIVVNPRPLPITGTTNVCFGLTMSLSDGLHGGTWSSSDPATAVVDPSLGVVTGITTGAAVISYELPTGCLISTPVVFQQVPAAIAGAADLCVGTTIVLSDPTSGGTWSTSDATVATVDTGGTVTGLAGGTPTITYTIGTGCISITSFNVNALPAAPAPIVGTTTLCQLTASVLSDATPGGTWSSSNPAFASADATTGTVIGLSPGLTMIMYTVTNACGSTSASSSLVVTPLPATPPSITGVLSLCEAGSSLLSDAVSEGAWSSDAPSVATISTSGLVTGLSAGTAMITYTRSNSCGTAATSTQVTVNPLPTIPAAITGLTSVCAAGAVTSLGEITAGGVWSSSNMVVATVNATGLVTGIAAGLANISYTMSNGCGSVSVSAMVTVDPLPVSPAVITGTGAICPGNSAALHDATPGGVWSSSNATVATINTSGIATGIAAGTTSISYTESNGCGTAWAVTTLIVNPLAVADSITGIPVICVGSVSLLNDMPAGGLWLSDNNAVAVVNTLGIVTAIAPGTATISYIASNSCGSSAAATRVVTVNQVPSAGTILGSDKVCLADTVILSNNVGGGRWGSSNPLIASVSAAGVVSGLYPGFDTIIYTVTNSCGTVTSILPFRVRYFEECYSGTKIVNGNAAELKVYPNPNNASFTLHLSSGIDEQMHVIITDLIGRKIDEFTAVSNSDVNVKLGQVAAGSYFITAVTESGRHTVKMIVQ